MNWLEEVYHEHRQELFHLAWLILRDNSLAEDAVQNGFLKLIALKKRPLNPTNYSRQVIRNAAIDLLRSNKRQTTVSLPEITGSFQNQENSLWVDELLMSLSNSKREVVEFHLRLGMSFKEIADLLGEPVSTVSSRFQRSIKELQKAVKEDEANHSRKTKGPK